MMEQIGELNEMFKSKKLKELLEETKEKLTFIEEEYYFIYKINERRRTERKCDHKEKVYLKHLPRGQVWMRVCDSCGQFSPIMCGHGGSGYMCPECIPKIAKKVIIL